MILFLYRFFFFILTPLLLLALIVRSISDPKYRQRLSERLGGASENIPQYSIVVHAASVGEVIAIKSYVEHLLSENLNVVVTTFTPTGSEQVKKQFGDRVHHCYLPLDIWPCTWLFLQRVKPKALVLMETELWPNLIAQCHQKGIKLQLINARLSAKSIKSYLKIKPLMSRALNHFDQILCQSHESHQRFIALGAKQSLCEVPGNLKFDLSTNDNINNKAQHLRHLLPKNKSVWLVASSHPGDEAIALSAYKVLAETFPELLLVIVPRHPERFETVFNLSQTSGFVSQKRSTEYVISPETQVWILDTLGELMSAYQLADYVTIAGTFSNIGGHNPLEPALYKKPIIVGSDMNNFKEISSLLHKAQGFIQLKGESPSEELIKEISTLIELPQLGKTLGNNAYTVVQQNQGASLYCATALLKLFPQE